LRSITTYGWRFGQQIYTASDIKLRPEQIRQVDHPYAGWLYGGFFKQIQGNDGTHTRVGIDIGCLGPCAGGEWTQTNLHRVLNQPLPQGWDKQVKNELGVVLHAEIAPVRWTPHRAFDITPHVKLRFGNIFTDVGAGVLLRAGQLHVSPAQSSFHGFLRAEMLAVGHNGTLQGGYFSKNNPHTVEPKRFVGEAAIGAVWRSGQYGFTASLVRRSNENRALPDSIGAQNFVRLQFSYTP
jgi:lipid A 3-O-deacylase